MQDSKPNCVIVFTGLPGTVLHGLDRPTQRMRAEYSANPLDNNIQHVLDQIRNLPQYSA